jgi:carboxymethylenebutenolidase
MRGGVAGTAGEATGRSRARSPGIPVASVAAVHERSEQVEAPDGSGSFAAHVTIPDAGTGPGVVVLHEIFGVNDYITAACRRLAGLGYVALAPDLFWRVAPGLALSHDEEGLTRAMENVGRFDAEAAVGDAAAALERLRSLPEVTGGVGVLGFCLGGTLAYLVAAAASPDGAVSYYGSGVPGALDQADAIDCPLLVHFGGDDPYIPREQVEAARQALASRPNVSFVVHEDAGHAFDNSLAPMFHQPEAAAAAWDRTAAFLAEALPVA